MAQEKDPYLDTVDRMEPNITSVDLGAASASIAISLKRIADNLQTLPEQIQLAIQEAIWNATRKE